MIVSPDLAQRLASHGPHPYEAELQALATIAESHAVDPVLVGVLRSADEPDVARLRAFARIIATLRHPSRPSLRSAA